MHVKRAGVVGAGTMGSAIAEVLAYNGIEVVLKDLDTALVEKGVARVRQYVDELLKFHAERADREIGRLRELGLELTPEQTATLKTRLAPKFTSTRAEEVVGRVHGTTAWDEFANVDLVVEAAFEKLEVKRELFEKLDAVLPEHAILGSNTSSLSVTRLARGLRHTPQILVTHFFNPPVTLPLVEVAAGVETREDVVTDVIDFLQGLRNHRFPLVPIRVQESPGFVVNRILTPVMAEACFVLQEGIASARDIDQAMKAGAGMPMGPFELADLVGLDVTLEVLNTLYREFQEPRYRAPTALRRLVDAGHLGRKTGRGFYEYT